MIGLLDYFLSSAMINNAAVIYMPINNCAYLLGTFLSIELSA